MTTALPIIANLRPLDKVNHFVPLGIRFWDFATEKSVTDGLDVTARRLDRSHPVRRAFQSISGIYAFRDLPGLRRIERPDPDLPAGVHPVASSPPDQYPFVIRVADRLGRYLAVNFQVDLPHRGIYPIQPPSTSPPGSGLPGFFLFSSPTRQLLSSLAMVQAQLFERLGPGQFRPAAHATMEIIAPRQPVWRGIADERGTVLVAFPYPPFATEVAPVSPPLGAPETRVQAWDITVRVNYRSDIEQSTPDSVALLPDLGDILTQPPASLWLTQSGPGLAQLDTRLIFGQPLRLQTAGAAELWIET